MLTKPLELKALGAVSSARVVVRVDPEDIELSDRFIQFVKDNADAFGNRTPDEILAEVRHQYVLTPDKEDLGQ
ncbi:MAG TPA: hypothetical protein VK256_09245 [Candidatus Eisenbacteria bacterium]|nr:hypothetical protein [Candidatus Eisenbacteria bacterium]